MLEIDHLVVHTENINSVEKLKEKLDEVGIPFEPNWGKKAKGFRVSNIWMGKQYFEVVTITDANNLWQPQWAKRFADGDRGTFCIFFKIDFPISELHAQLKDDGFSVTQPERTEFKWFFGLFKKSLPWRFFLTSRVPGTDIELGFIEYDTGAERKFAPYMVPNTREVGLKGLSSPTINSSAPGQSEIWLDRLQNVIGDTLNLSVKPQVGKTVLELNVDAIEGHEFPGVEIVDILLAPVPR